MKKEKQGENIRKAHEVIINKSKCVKCGLCVRDCPGGVIVLGDAGAEIKIRDCIKCAHCVAICPKNAISVTGFEEPEDITNLRVDKEILLRQMKERRSVRQ
ncbi:MAG: 4Fe-4S binding protein, partial [Treponema sp.]|nr:4Fe-4S binding protein [Treponema sp.]